MAVQRRRVIRGAISHYSLRLSLSAKSRSISSICYKEETAFVSFRPFIIVTMCFSTPRYESIWSNVNAIIMNPGCSRRLLLFNNTRLFFFIHQKHIPDWLLPIVYPNVFSVVSSLLIKSISTHTRFSGSCFCV